jgi:hypothetical protein
MAPPEFVLKGKRRNYPILITHVSIMAMEQETGVKLTQLFQHIGKSGDAQSIKRKSEREKRLEELATTIGLTEVLSLMFAGMEGFRRKFKTRLDPYTIDDAGDALEDCGGIPGVQDPLSRCFTAYWPTAMGITLEDSAKKNKNGRPAKKSKTSART